MTDHVKLRVQRDGTLDEMPLPRRVGYRAARTFGVVERLITSAGLIENGSRLDLGFFRPNQNDAAVVPEVKGNAVAAPRHGGPAAFRSRSCLRSAFAVGVRFRHRARPVLVHMPLKMDAALRSEKADQRDFDFRGSLELHETDKHTGGLGRGQVGNEPLPPPGPDGEKNQQQSQ